MKKVFALCIGVLLFVACEQDTLVPEIEEINIDQTTLAKKGVKVDVCHKGKIINVSVNSLSGHQVHGDAVDMDGDGYFDIENDCSDVDCDDTDATVNPGMVEVCDDGIDNNCDGEVDEDCGPVLNEGEVLSANGRIWMDRNLGATQAATSSMDADSYGDFYQWGRATTDFTTVTGFPYDWSSPQNDNLWQGVNGVNNPCPDGFRIPTEAEWNEERLSWNSYNAAGALASPLKLPMAGYRHRSNGAVDAVGSFGDYWSSTVSGTRSRYLAFDSSTAFMNTYDRAYGFSVRCLKD